MFVKKLDVNKEKIIIVKTIGYLITRDILLLTLVFTHIIAYYNNLWERKSIFLSISLVVILIWILFFINILFNFYKLKKDKVLVQAFKDEYFYNIKIKSGSNGYIIMLLTCMIFIIINLIFNMLSIQVDFPSYFFCDIIFLIGIITNDISKILLSVG